jgi:hypothetical protein
MDSRSLYAMRQLQSFFYPNAHDEIPLIEDVDSETYIARLLRAIRPYDVAEVSKVRVGPYKDGGYVMLDPGKRGIAYSFGVSTYAPWDMEMAQRGFRVYQYDASIAQTPTVHPNIFFYPFFVVGDDEPAANAKNLRQIFAENGHDNEYGMVLQMDIEGAEWDIFANLDEDALLHFKQVIVEFHYINFDEKKLEILEKILNTHIPVHIHVNNHGDDFYYTKKNNFLWHPNLLEITYARIKDYTYTPCNNYFPTPLDAANEKDKPDVPIGFFDLLLEETKWDKSIGALLPLPPRDIPAHLLNPFSMGGHIPVITSYWDSRTLGDNVHITRGAYERAIEALENRTFQYYGNEVNAFYDALDDYALEGKRVLVWGLAGINCDAIALWKKAAEVYVVDYNKPVCDHDAVHVVTHEELRGLSEKFDFAFSFSSFEHDGLGRYGDPINPDGDLIAMREAGNYLHDEGIMFFGVPLGQDCLVWNAHRIYGPTRLPLLLQGWFPLNVYSIYTSVFDKPVGTVLQPLLVLKKNGSQIPEKKDILGGIQHAKSLIKGTVKGTKNGKILQQILEMLLKSNI